MPFKPSDKPEWGFNFHVRDGANTCTGKCDDFNGGLQTLALMMPLEFPWQAKEKRNAKCEQQIKNIGERNCRGKLLPRKSPGKREINNDEKEKSYQGTSPTTAS